MEKTNMPQLLAEATDFISRSYAVTNNPIALGQVVSANESAYETLLSKLSEGMDPIEARDFTQLGKNCMSDRSAKMFFENTSANMSNFAILDTMMLREIWDRIGARDAMTYKVLEQPYIQIPFLKQYMKNGAGELVDVPTALKANSFTGKVFDAQLKFTDTGDSKFVNYASFNAFLNFTAGGAAIDTQGDRNPNKIVNLNGKMTLDGFGEIYEVVVNEDDKANWNNGNTKDQTIPVSFKADTEGNFFATVKFIDKTHADSGNPSGATNYSDTIMGKVNRLTGDVTFSVMKGHIRKLKFRTKISQETNRFTSDMVQKLEKVIVNVGDGDTINSSVSIQYLQDTKALLKIDAISEISKLLSQTFAQVYDNEIYKTISDSIVSASQKSEFNASMLQGGAHIGISRQMHNANLLDKVVKACGIIDDTYNFSSAVDYYVLCNPIENSILASAIAPDYAGSVFKGGVVKPYAGGQVVGGYGQGDIRVVSSRHYDRGQMLVVPKPSVDQEIVFGYYDYAQVLMPLGAYRSEYNELVPTITMNKRKAIHAFRPESTHCVTVKNSTQDKNEAIV